MRIALAAFSALLIAGPAHADEARDALEAIAKCANVPDSAERLKCYDAAAPRVRSALATPPQPAKEPGVTVESFGLPRAQKPVLKAEDFGKPPAPPGPEEVTSITATVLEFSKTARGKALFFLANGQVWRQLDSDGTELPYPPAGAIMRVTVETGWLGSYNLTIEGRNGLIKVTRLK
jgi:hypothetical protein